MESQTSYLRTKIAILENIVKKMDNTINFWPTDVFFEIKNHTDELREIVRQMLKEADESDYRQRYPIKT